MTEVQQHPAVLRNIEVAKIQPNPFQHREHFDEASLDELGQSIREKGVIQPITVRDISANGVEAYQLIAGERRWRACERIGRPTIPALIVEADDDDSVEMALVENLQRENLRIIEEARGLASLLDRYDGNKSRVAERIGKSIGYVNDRLALLELPEEVQNMMDRGELNVAQAKVLLEVGDTANQLKWAKQVAKRGLNADQLRGMTQNLTGRRGRKSSRDKRDRRVTFKGMTSIMISLYEDTQALKADNFSADQRQTIIQQADVLITALQELRKQLASKEEIASGVA